MAPAIRSLVLELDPNLPVISVETMDAITLESNWMDQFNRQLFAALAVIALILASIGVYGVINYSVTQRTREIGIRMALGAQLPNVRGLVVKQGLKLAGMGILTGIPAAYGLMRLMSSLLFGISPSDPVTFIGIALVMAVVELLASYFPARKATKVDPMIALRCE